MNRTNKPRGKAFNRRYPEQMRVDAKESYEEGESMEKVAKRLGVPLGTVKSWRQQARRSSHMGTWDRRNGEARRQAKKLASLPELSKHLVGASNATKATAAMFAEVPKGERLQLINAMQNAFYV